MISREQQRADNRSVDCPPASGTPEPCLVKPQTVRLVDPCGDVTLPDPCAIDASQFFTPVPPAPTVDAPPALYPTITVASLAASGNCGALTGSPVTIAAGLFTSVVSFAVVTGMSDTQRAFLAAVPQGTLDGLVGQSALQVAQVTGLTIAQAGQVVTALTAAEVTVAASAAAAVAAALNCYYVNTAQTASCGAGSVTAPVTVAAGTFTSVVSVEAANEAALAAAQSQLVCAWLNASQTANCGAGATVGLGNPSTVAAGSVTSTISQADADEQALAIATSLLVCSYPNTQQGPITCPVDSGGVAANTGASNPITIAAGTFTSSINQADANAQAVLAANQLLRCQWGNDQTTVVCPTSGGQPASATVSPVYQVVIPANTFLSDISRAEANAQALQFANSQLDCLYCNLAVPAACVNVNGPSIDATAPVAAGTFCATTFGAAQSLATTLAAIPIEVSANGALCRYANDQIIAKCVGDGVNFVGPYNVTTGAGLSAVSLSQSVTVPAGTFITTTSKADANAQAAAAAIASLNCFWSSPAAGPINCPADSAVGSSPPASNPLFIPAGLFTSYTSLAQVNAMLSAYISTVTICLWTNDAQVGGACPGSTTAIQNGSVGAGVVISHTSKTDANNQAKTLATALNVCAPDSMLSAPGEPGSAGPSGSCNAPCAAFYT